VCPSCFTKWFVSRLPFDPAAGVGCHARASPASLARRQRRSKTAPNQVCKVIIYYLFGYGLTVSID
jgi:hypothetical protein